MTWAPAASLNDTADRASWTASAWVAVAVDT